MPSDRGSLVALRARVAALRAPSCAMAHESIALGPDARPVRSSLSPSGYARVGICPASTRANHVGCSHTTARYLLRDALDTLPDDADAALKDDLRALENAISLLDHRRYDAETRHAQALDGGTPAEAAAARRVIDDLVAEHRACAVRALALRDAVLARLDAALTSSDLVADVTSS